MIKTRFAPSPTGYLHIGGVRTALFSWLYAKKHKGQFVLRIEDTDLERSTQESVDAILNGMDWVALNYDEGPYYQTQRFDRYKAVIKQLLDQGDAYYCTCSRERLDEVREQQRANKQKPKYDGCCRHAHHSASDNAVIRFKNPESGAVSWHDLVKGVISINNEELDDLIIARTDGTPTYNFTVVVDDWDMKISHVVRGDDHINNTPRQINILNALHAELPKYAHLPMILGDDGKRLSKRHGAVSVLQYQQNGILPHALINYLVRLGWSYGDQEIFSLDEMIEHFDLSNVNAAASAFNTEKLLWLNQHYIKTISADELLPHLQTFLDERDIQLDKGCHFTDVLKHYAERSKTLIELADAIAPYYKDFETYDAKAAKKHLKAAAVDPLLTLNNQLSSINEWTEANCQQAVDTTLKTLDIGMGKLGMPLRVALCGAGFSPSLAITLTMMGKQRTIKRINQAIEWIKQRVAAQ